LPGSKTRTKITEPLDLNAFSSQYASGFYHYTGSLTTPPCSEKVHWYVLEKPAPITTKMVSAFKQRFPENNRPIQPLNNRQLVASMVGLPGEFPAAASAPKTSGPVPWGYQDTKQWNAAFPACAGNEQTPIDLSPSAVSSTSQESLSSLMSYTPLKDLDIFNNGNKNVQVNGGFGSLKLPDGDYEVMQFHFHFPSEHSVNGKLAAGELHIVHQKKGSKGTNDLAVVGILLKETSSMKAATPEFKFMQQLGFGDELPGSRTKTKIAEPLDLNAFASEYDDDFYHYTGSLTTPPCSEKVHWYVLERPALVTKDMVKSFKQRFPENNRPIQPLNTRQLLMNSVAVSGEFPVVVPQARATP